MSRLRLLLSAALYWLGDRLEPLPGYVYAAQDRLWVTAARVSPVSHEFDGVM